MSEERNVRASQLPRAKVLSGVFNTQRASISAPLTQPPRASSQAPQNTSPILGSPSSRKSPLPRSGSSPRGVSLNRLSLPATNSQSRSRTHTSKSPSPRPNAPSTPRHRASTANLSISSNKEFHRKEREKRETDSEKKEREELGFKKEIESFRDKLVAEVAEGTAVKESLAEQNNRIRVYVRKRPMNSREIERQYDVLTPAAPVPINPEVTPSYAKLYVHEPRWKSDLHGDRQRVLETLTFRYDDVFDESISNATVYENTAKPIIEKVMNGAQLTLFSYGQTGSGKTYTMFGTDGTHPEAELNEDNIDGLYFYALSDIYDQLEHYPHLKAYVSFFEIHRNRIFDLFASRARCTLMTTKAGRTRVMGLMERSVASFDEALHLVKVGCRDRARGVTELNPDSAASRSHAILRVHLCEGLGEYTSSGREKRRVVGGVHLVDLAGSERAGERGEGVKGRNMMKEGGEINQSLLALKECIRALSRRSTVKIPKNIVEGEGAPAQEGQKAEEKPLLGHVPFRASKLTLVLKDSLIGSDSITVLIANVSPASGSVEHTVNTLRYARRVKTVKVRRRKKKVRKVVKQEVITEEGDAKEIEIEVEVEEEVDEDEDEDDDDDDDDEEDEQLEEQLQEAEEELQQEMQLEQEEHEEQEEQEEIPEIEEELSETVEEHLELPKEEEIHSEDLLTKEISESPDIGFLEQIQAELPIEDHKQTLHRCRRWLLRELAEIALWEEEQNGHDCEWMAVGCRRRAAAVSAFQKVVEESWKRAELHQAVARLVHDIKH